MSDEGLFEDTVKNLLKTPHKPHKSADDEAEKPANKDGRDKQDGS